MTDGSLRDTVASSRADDAIRRALRRFVHCAVDANDADPENCTEEAAAASVATEQLYAAIDAYREREVQRATEELRRALFCFGIEPPENPGEEWSVTLGDSPEPGGDTAVAAAATTVDHWTKYSDVAQRRLAEAEQRISTLESGIKEALKPSPQFSGERVAIPFHAFRALRALLSDAGKEKPA